MDSKRTARHVLPLVVSSIVTFTLISCGELVRTGSSPAFLVIDVLEAASGAEPDDFRGVLNSDVETMVSEVADGEASDAPAVFSDIGRVTLRLGLKNPGVSATPLTPSSLNEITVSRYRVTFRRADGRNTPGVDVPHPFDGGVTFTVRSDATAMATFAVVRHQAKLEPPLSRLRRGGGANVISAIAEVTFYGRDQSGNVAAVTGLLSVNFGDFRDPR